MSARCPQRRKEPLTKAEATARAAAFNRRVPGTSEAYACPAGHWHVGTPIRRARPGRASRGRRNRRTAW